MPSREFDSSAQPNGRLQELSYLASEISLAFEWTADWGARGVKAKKFLRIIIFDF